MTEPVNPTAIADLTTEFPDKNSLDTFDERASELFSYLVYTMVPGANTVADEAYTNALAAKEAADISYLNANFKGAWSSLTGALTVPALVSHSGSRWNLLNDLVDVTASEPGVSADWEPFSLPTASGIGYDNSYSDLDSTDVQAAIDELKDLSDTSLSGFRNRIINGDMRVDQYGVIVPSLAITPGQIDVHLIDGWKFYNNSDASLTETLASESLPDGKLAKWLKTTVNTADSSIAAGQFVFINTKIEGYDAADLVGQTFTVHGYVKSSETGIHCVEIRNAGYDRYFIGEVNIIAADTPQKYSITVPGGIPSGGVWNFTNGIGLEIGFMLAAGSDLYGLSGSWQTGASVITSSQVNAIGTAGNVFAITEVQLEIGEKALPFERIPFHIQLSRCQRYYQKLEYFDSGYGTAGTSYTKARTLICPVAGISVTVPSFVGATYSNCTNSGAAVLAERNTVTRTITVTATGNYETSGTMVIDRRL